MAITSANPTRTASQKILRATIRSLAYEKLGIEASIKDANGNYSMLEAIVANAQGNSALNPGRNSRKSIEVFRELGNYSAHKIT